MYRVPQHWIALGFVLLALAALAGMVLLASGRWRPPGEALGLAVGALVLTLFWLALARR
jgi:hypothetical protein